MPQMKTVKKYGFFITLIVTANLVGFNPALAFSDQDFAHLEGRVRALDVKVLGAPEKPAGNIESLERSVRALELKVLSPQENLAIAMCMRVYTDEKLVSQAVQNKNTALKNWDKKNGLACLRFKPNPYGGGFAPLDIGFADQDCLKTQAVKKAAALAKYDVVVKSTETEFQVAQDLAKSQGAVCGLVFNPPLASVDKDFKRLLERVRALEDKVFNAQQKAKVAICEKVHAHEMRVTQAIKQKRDSVNFWKTYGDPVEVCHIGTPYPDYDCLKRKQAQRDQEFRQRDQEIQTAQQELNSARAEAKSAGAVCNQ